MWSPKWEKEAAFSFISMNDTVKTEFRMWALLESEQFFNIFSLGPYSL